MKTTVHDEIALFDLDGTLADFDAAMAAELVEMGTLPRLLDRDSDETTPAERRFMSRRRRVVRERPGFWRNLPRLEKGFDVLDVATALGFETHVLTKGPKNNSAAWMEKVQWCAKHVPDVPVTIAQKKSLVYGRVLVDDWPGYFLPWLDVRPRGLVVAIAHPWNESVSHSNVVRYDGTNILEVRERMAEAFFRSSNAGLERVGTRKTQSW